MTGVRKRGEEIRRFILANVPDHPQDIASVTAAEFGVSRQAVNKHLARLVDEKALMREGNTRKRTYTLCRLDVWEKVVELVPNSAEDLIWRDHIANSLQQLPDNVLQIWQYGASEMLNNVIDHSEGSHLYLRFERTAADTELTIGDNGVGIFRKIQRELGLLDERDAVLELAKGKLTTDPANHSGEGIFFTSRMFDVFDILSGGVFFTHKFESDEDWILDGKYSEGTWVWMKVSNHTARTTKQVFDQYSSGDDYGFTRTVVPVKLAQYGDDLLVSRSQAKRLLARVDRFRTVLFDFEGVEAIGQAFADEIFRVFARKHPEITLLEVNTVDEVQAMVSRARSGAA